MGFEPMRQLKKKTVAVEQACRLSAVSRPGTCAVRRHSGLLLRAVEYLETTE